MKWLSKLFRWRRRSPDTDDPKTAGRQRGETTGTWGYFEARSAGREYDVRPEKFSE